MSSVYFADNESEVLAIVSAFTYKRYAEVLDMKLLGSYGHETPKSHIVGEISKQKIFLNALEVLVKMYQNNLDALTDTFFQDMEVD